MFRSLRSSPHGIVQPEEGLGVLHAAWSTVKRFAGRVLGRPPPSGHRGYAPFSAADTEGFDDEDQAGRPMLGRSNGYF
jgi:hypothetical protein